MKILTIGISPYTFISSGQMHSVVIKYLYSQGHSVASLVWHHDVSLFTPDEVDGVKNFYYEFRLNGGKHKVPVVPFKRGLKEASSVYELIQEFSPDIILTVGDIDDFMFMKAIKMFSSSLPRWGAILKSKELPLPQESNEIFDDIDAILCSSKNFYEYAKQFFKNEHINYRFFGCNSVFDFEKRNQKRGEYQIVCSGKNSQSDNLPMVMEAVSELRIDFPEIKLHVHSNIYDAGEYNLVSIKERFDPNDEFISFTEKYVSLFDGLPQEEYADILSKASVYIHPHLVSSTSVSVFEALGCGCFPVLNACGSNLDLFKNLLIECPKIEGDEILIKNIPFMTSSEGYLFIPDKNSIKDLLTNYFKKREKYREYKKEFLKFARKYNQRMFTDKIDELLGHLINKKETLCLET